MSNIYTLVEVPDDFVQACEKVLANNYNAERAKALFTLFIKNLVVKDAEISLEEVIQLMTTK